MKWLTLLVFGLLASGCSLPPPTSAGAIAKEPTRLYWGSAQAPGDTSTKSVLDPPLDFVVVAGRLSSNSDDPAQTWHKAIAAAKAENEPCVFTSFIGWEATSTLQGHSLDHVVFTNAGEDQANELVPLVSTDGTTPKDLRKWIEETSHRVDADFVVVPPEKAATGSTKPQEALVPSRGDEISFRGVVAAWAEENTRTSIFAAFERNEVYATTGPRIRVRFFGGWGFNAKNAKSPAMVQTAYTLGHPMGGKLSAAPDGKAPGFLMYAIKDPKGADLDRIQIVKGWVDADGTVHRKVYDAVRPTVDKSKKEKKKEEKAPPTASVALGAPALFGFWSDPHFDPKQPAFYYMRALQVAAAKRTEKAAVPSEARSDDPPTLHEHAYTAPIWYTP